MRHRDRRRHIDRGGERQRKRAREKKTRVCRRKGLDMTTGTIANERNEDTQTTASVESKAGE